MVRLIFQEKIVILQTKNLVQNGIYSAFLQAEDWLHDGFVIGKYQEKQTRSNEAQ